MDKLEILPVRTRITSILRKAIYLGEYKGNDTISLTDVARQLNVSRTPVREALQDLESEGLVTLRMNKSATVNAIDRKFISDTLEVRTALESKAAEKAAENGMETAELLARLYKLRDSLDHVDNDEYLQLNQDVHASIWKAAGNKKLEAILMKHWSGPNHVGDTIARQRHYKQSTDEHIAVLEAIRDGKPEEAVKAMNQHITRSMENILSLYEE